SRLTSHEAYTGTISIPWLKTATALRMLGESTDAAHLAYTRLMSEPQLEGEAAEFARDASHDTVALGGAEFLASLPQRSVAFPLSPALESLTSSVLRLLGLEHSEVFGRSRARLACLARAMIAWHAADQRIASFAEAARFVGRDPSTLNATIDRHRLIYPQY